MWLLSRPSQMKRRLSRPTRSSRRRSIPWQGRPEPLEERVVLGTFAGSLSMVSATSLSPQVVSAQYQVTGASLGGTVTLEIYRSPTAAFITRCSGGRRTTRSCFDVGSR